MPKIIAAWATIVNAAGKGAVDAAVEQAHKQLGHIDVAFNNAGYALFGAIEEVSEQEALHRSKPTCSALCG